MDLHQPLERQNDRTWRTRTLWSLRTSAVWRDLGTEYSHWTTVWRTQVGGIDSEGLPKGDDCLGIGSRYGETGVEGQ